MALTNSPKTRLVGISRRLRREQEPALYGNEESGIPLDELYSF
jgi:hypothetical protein